MTREEEIEAHRAQQLLDDPLLQRMFGDLGKECIEQLVLTTDATPEADLKRRELIDRYNTINGVLGHLGRKTTALRQASRPKPGIA